MTPLEALVLSVVGQPMAGLCKDAMYQAAPVSLGPEAVYPHDSAEQSAGRSTEGGQQLPVWEGIGVQPLL